MRVLVFRPFGQSEETAERLAGLGHEAILAPVLTIAQTGTPPPAGLFDALLVTSRNAVEALREHRGQLRGLRVFAVGPRTGGALAGVGFSDIEVAEGDAVSLARLVAERLSASSALLHAAGRDRRAELQTMLESAGHSFTTWEVYAAEPAPRLPEEAKRALTERAVDAALHYSPRSAEIAFRLVREAGLGQAFWAVPHLCLSANVAAALGEHPGRTVIAGEPSEESLFDLLDEAAGRTD